MEFKEEEFINVDYKKQEIKDPELKKTIEDLGNSSEGEKKIKQLDEKSLTNLKEIADRAGIGLEIFIPSVSQYPEMVDEVVRMLDEWEEINKKVLGTNNVNEKFELSKGRKVFEKRLDEILDECL